MYLHFTLNPDQLRSELQKNAMASKAKLQASGAQGVIGMNPGAGDSENP